MKVLLACPGFDNPTCGIGNYSKQFVAALTLLGDSVVCYGGPLLGLYDRILEFQPDVVHIQFEYGWASAERLVIISDQCKRHKIKLVVTFHSVGPSVPHNYKLAMTRYARIVVHSEALKCHFPLFECSHIPLAIPQVAPAQDAIVIPRDPSFRRIGWFGNVFFHKGLHALLSHAWQIGTTELLILGGKPPHSVEYYERCKELAKNSTARVLWYDSYLPDAHVVAHLATCDEIAFPYEEYGATGCSAAIRLAFNAERPCFVSKTSHFADLSFHTDGKGPCPVHAMVDLYDNPTRSYDSVPRANLLRSEWSFLAIASRHQEEVYV